MRVGGQRHAPTALPPGKTRYPLYKRLGRLQGRSGRVWKISPPPVFDSWTVQPVVSRYTDLGKRYSKIWWVATRTGWLPAGLSQACDIEYINRSFIFCSGEYYFLYKEIMDTCLWALYIPMFHALIRYIDLKKKNNKCTWVYESRLLHSSYRHV
jgi:hypothetical protein